MLSLLQWKWCFSERVAQLLSQDIVTILHLLWKEWEVTDDTQACILSISMCWMTNSTAMRCLHESLCHILAQFQLQQWKCKVKLENAVVNNALCDKLVLSGEKDVNEGSQQLLGEFSDEFTSKTTPKRSTCVHRSHQCLHLRLSSCDTNGDTLKCSAQHNYPNKKHLLQRNQSQCFLLGW